MKVESAEFIRAAHGMRDFLRDDLPQLAFVGRSNVGKSSLMNCLLGRAKLARTSSTPGRTRSVNYFLVNRRYYFVDLPGYGYAKASKADRQDWAVLVDDYFRQTAGRVAVVQLVDGKVGATPLDLQGYEYLLSIPVPVTVVATKIDKVGRSKRAKALAEVRRTLEMEAGDVPLGVSAKSGDGIKELWRVLHDRLRGVSGVKD